MNKRYGILGVLHTHGFKKERRNNTGRTNDNDGRINNFISNNNNEF